MQLGYYEFKWSEYSAGSKGSIPIGNGSIGINLWVESDGNIYFYISSTDAWDENARLVKIGRIKVSMIPNLLIGSIPPTIHLDVKNGQLKVKAKDVTSTIWVDANHPVINVEAESRESTEIIVELNLWRTKKRELKGKEQNSAYGLQNGPKPIYVYPDNIVETEEDEIIWFHRNEHSLWRDNLEMQGLGSLIEKFTDPILSRTFGGTVKGENFKKIDSGTLKSIKSGRTHRFSVYILVSQSNNWFEELRKSIRKVESINYSKRFSAHVKWWNEFWNRSWLIVDGFEQADVINRGYILQRFLNACGGRGNYPIKFNGSIFTADWEYPGEEFDADYRRWGGPYWFQNTRLTYWPMLVAGDFDLMKPLFEMYRNALPLAKERTRIYFGHNGAFFPETMYFWGTYAENNYGWNRKGKDISYIECGYIRYYWQGGLELLALGLEYFTFTNDVEFFSYILLPLAEEILQFYEEHYPRNSSGKIVIQPAQSLETWWEVINPLPEIAGLQWTLDRLLSLPDELIISENRLKWEKLRSALPNIPMKKINGQEILAPAEKILVNETKNIENPELYAVFPYQLYGVGKKDLELARRTFEKKLFDGNSGWRQEGIWAAYLGLVERAKQDLIARFTTKYEKARFDAFWGPNYDWIPDQDHGSCAIMTFQSMLIQWNNENIYLFPSWPKKWNVSFKLHAPNKTMVEGIYHNGKLSQSKVIPKSREKDITILL